ncbi:maleate cis-trans isomerase family protein [Ottowia thiooxydans]|uniref:maleate cis-trans isomerase family protein n=1 Tax=Ottowia thiooxydans TaxID=219182 RepID=UPI0004074AB0|nr:aspartate/glutamate racemase family protein [Ottowia thiooxydans]
MNTLTAPTRTYQKHPFKLGTGPASRAAIGLIVLATDHTIEHEWHRIMQLDGVALYQSRLYNSADINPQTLAAMEKDIAPAVSLILPGQRMDVVAFGCTSGAMVIGEEAVFERIREVRPGVACTSPITAAQVALKTLGARRVGLLTPYVKSVSDWMADYIADRGFDVTASVSYEHADDNEVARIDEASIRASVLELGKSPDVDAVFVSCTSMRLASQVTALEQAIGKPVISSNHAMAWHALRLAGIHDALPQWGRLYSL